MPRILIIDDDNDLLKISESLLSSRGFKVSIHSDWQHAYSTIPVFDPDVILLDVFLQDSDGLKICKTLKSSENTAHIPIIIFSGYPEMAIKIYDYGADAFIAKPFETTDLVKRIHHVLSGEDKIFSC